MDRPGPVRLFLHEVDPVGKTVPGIEIVVRLRRLLRVHADGQQNAALLRIEGIQEGKHGGQFLLRHLVGHGDGLGQAGHLIHAVRFLPLLCLTPIDIVDGLAGAHDHDAGGPGVARVQLGPHLAVAADPKAHLSGVDAGGIDGIHLVAGALGKGGVQITLLIPGVHTGKIGPQVVAAAAEGRVVVACAIPHGRAAAESGVESAVLVVALEVGSEAVSIRDAQILNGLGEDVEHPLPVADVDGLRAAAGEDDVVGPGLGVLRFAEAVGEGGPGHRILTVFGDPVPAIEDAHEVALGLFPDAVQGQVFPVVGYVGLEIGGFFQGGHVVGHVLLHIGGQIMEDAVLIQLPCAHLGTGQVQNVRILLRGEEGIEVVQLRSGRGYEEGQIHLLPSEGHGLLHILHAGIFLIGRIIGGIRTGGDPPGQLQRFGVAVRRFGLAAAAKDESDTEQQANEQRSFFHHGVLLFRWVDTLCRLQYTAFFRYADSLFCFFVWHLAKHGNGHLLSRTGRVSEPDDAKAKKQLAKPQGSCHTIGNKKFVD